MQRERLTRKAQAAQRALKVPTPSRRHAAGGTSKSQGKRARKAPVRRR